MLPPLPPTTINLEGVMKTGLERFFFFLSGREGWGQSSATY